jgi:crossover junction endodeoxyribonuclease RuvC
LLELEQDLVLLLREFRLGIVALEMPIITSENPQNSRSVLEAVGVIHLVCYREAGIVPVHLYPGMWKSNLGNGWASSDEVTDTIAAMFDLGEMGKTRLDAIAIAYAGFYGVGR